MTEKPEYHPEVLMNGGRLAVSVVPKRREKLTVTLWTCVAPELAARVEGFALKDNRSTSAAVRRLIEIGLSELAGRL